MIFQTTFRWWCLCLTHPFSWCENVCPLCFLQFHECIPSIASSYRFLLVVGIIGDRLAKGGLGHQHNAQQLPPTNSNFHSVDLPLSQAPARAGLQCSHLIFLFISMSIDSELWFCQLLVLVSCHASLDKKAVKFLIVTSAIAHKSRFLLQFDYWWPSQEPPHQLASTSMNTEPSSPETIIGTFLTGLKSRLSTFVRQLPRNKCSSVPVWPNHKNPVEQMLVVE